MAVDTPLIERETAWCAGSTLLDRIAATTGGSLSVEVPAGIEKTSVLEAVTDQARAAFAD